MYFAVRSVVVALGLFTPSIALAALVNVLTIPGNSVDLSSSGVGANFNRLGGFSSDLYYDRFHDEYYGITDRGPGGGLLPFSPRVQKFALAANSTTGTIGNFQLQSTILFKTTDGGATFDGRNPAQLTGSASTLGLSLDPEGLLVLPSGNLLVADEYGPSLYEFNQVNAGNSIEARFQRAFNIPVNFRPMDNLGAVNHVAERNTNPALVSGRQGNRGFEGLAISPDGTTLFAAMQDPLAQEGSNNQGRNSRNVRITRFDMATGSTTGQFIYQLEDRTQANTRIPGTANDFAANDQGRQIGISAMAALNDHQFLILERDTRGINADNPIGADTVNSQVAIKRIYEVDLDGATEVSGLSLAGTDNLPLGTIAASKSLLIDIQAELVAAGVAIPERMEGLTVGPRLTDGKYLLLVGTDNDFSISQLANGQQFDVYTDGSQDPVDADPLGRSLLPTYLYALAIDLPNYVAPVPEPGSLVLLTVGIAALLLASASRRR